MFFYIESFEPPVYHKILTNHKGFAVMYENNGVYKVDMDTLEYKVIK